MEENIQKLKDIFYSKFENPDNSEPFDTHEGGFLNDDKFVYTERAVQEAFQTEPLSDKEYSELVDNLNKESFKWVKRDEN